MITECFFCFAPLTAETCAKPPHDDEAERYRTRPRCEKCEDVFRKKDEERRAELAQLLVSILT